MTDNQEKGQRRVRSTVNLHELPALSETWVDWPPTEYVATMLRVGYLVLIDPPAPERTSSDEPDATSEN